MGTQQECLNRQDLLVALEKGWKHYLPLLAQLPEEEQARYAHEQGFSRVQDVLVHILAWWERTMQRSSRLLNGQSVPDSEANDLDDFNAEVVARYQQWTRPAVEAKFAATLAELERFIDDLPEEGLENDWIHPRMASLS